MPDINNATFSTTSSPKINYTITYTKSRPSNSQMKYNFTISAALNSSGSYINAGYAILCTMTVNGTSADVRIKANDNDNWSGTTPRVRTVSVTCSSTTGNATQSCTFKVVSDGRVALSGANITSSGYTVTSSALLYTACGAPTACSLNPTITETTSTLSWSGAKAGTNNAISAYEIQYSESTNNSSWGSWITGTTVSSTATSGSYAVTASGTRGNYRRYQVRTRGTAGASYYSGWKISTNSVRKNTVPTKPSSVTASPAAYSTENITVSWSGASGGTSAIKGYQIARRTSTNGSTWGSWTVVTTLNLSASSGSYTDTNPSRTPGTYTQYGIWTIDALNVYSAETISNSIRCDITACGAPTACSVSAALAEGNVTLSWSGASGGAGNAINSYEIQYSESSDGSAWDAWTALSTVTSTSTSGTLSVAPSSTRGNYRRFQIRTRGAAGASYYSVWRVSSNSVRRNVLPTPPRTVTASPSVYSGNQITVAWSDAVVGTSIIRSYLIQQSTSTDNQATWSAWETAATVTTSETFGSVVVSAVGVSRTFTRYRISVTDSLGGVTAYVLSNTVMRNSPPLAAFVEAPKAGATTYNSHPICLIQTQPEPDGHPQSIYVCGANGIWYNSVDNPDCFTTPGASAEAVKTVFFDPGEPETGQQTIIVQCRDEYSTGASVTRNFTVAANPFEDIVANETHVKASHILTLRTAANHVRDYFNLPPYAWASEVVPGRTQVRDWPFHVLELRAAVQGVIDKINSFDITAAEIRIAPIDWIDIGTGRPRADVMNQLMELILQL